MANRKYRDMVTNALNIFEENGEKVKKSFTLVFIGIEFYFLGSHNDN